MESLDVARQLLDTVDLAAPFDLDGDDLVGLVATHEIDRPARRRVFASHERQALLDRVG